MVFGPTVILALSSVAIVWNQSSTSQQSYVCILSLESIFPFTPTVTAWVLAVIISHKFYCHLPNWFWVSKTPSAHKGQISSLRTLLWFWLKIQSVNSLGSPSFGPTLSLSPPSHYLSGTSLQLKSIGLLVIPQGFSVFYAFTSFFPSLYNAILKSKAKQNTLLVEVLQMFHAMPFKKQTKKKKQLYHLSEENQNQYHSLSEIFHENSFPTLTLLCSCLYHDTSKIVSSICCSHWFQLPSYSCI